MTTRRRRALAGLLAPRRPRTIATYGVSPFDGTRESYALNWWQKHREAEPDDPWLSPFKSEAVQALLVAIAAAQANALQPGESDDELDIRGLAADAGCSEKEVEAFTLTAAGHSQRDIALALGVTRSCVWKRLDAARRKLVKIVPPLEVLRDLAPRTARNSKGGARIVAMTTRDEELSERTFKGQFDTTGQRVYYTLHAPMVKDPPQPVPSEWTRDDRSQAHRMARVLSDLIDHLESKGLISEKELDEILLLATR